MTTPAPYEPTDPLNTSPTHPTPSPIFPSPASTTTPTTTDQSPADIAAWQRTFYNSSLALLVLCPAVMLLPPRRIDLSTLALGTAWCMSAGYVSEVKTGHGVLWHVGQNLPSQRNRERREREMGERLWKGE